MNRTTCLLLLTLAILLLSACATPQQRSQEEAKRSVATDSAPLDPPADLASIPDAVPRAEPPSRYGNPASYVVFGRRYHTLASAEGYIERGHASWYGTKFHGRRTSSGEPYDMYAMTAAHRSLPLPSYVRVTNLDNGRSVVVRVNDRGPFIDGRIIDLSYAAAVRLGMERQGTARVEVRALQAEPMPIMAETTTAPVEPPAATTETTVAAREAAPAPRLQAISSAVAADGQPWLQAGAFSSRDNAENLQSRLQQTTARPVQLNPLQQGETTVWRVRIGPLPSVADATDLAGELRGHGIDSTSIVFE